MKKIYFLILLNFGAVLIFNRALAQKNQEVVWVDKFDKSTNQALTKGKWYTFTDSVGGGGSQIKKYYYKDPKRKNNTLSFTYELERAKWEWQPYVALACGLTETQIPAGPIKGIAYEFKGSKHSFIYRTTAIKDYAFYQIEVPECEVWTTIIIPFSELTQPDWGKAAPFNERDVNALSWQIVGKSKDSGTVTIDNIRLLRESPSMSMGRNELLVVKNKNRVVDTVYSKILSENREIWVHVPREKETSLTTSQYPVVYLLDGNNHFTTVVDMLNKMNADSSCPKMIVVGILNTNRTRDLTPTPFSGNAYRNDTRGPSNTGGGEIFTSFIEKELIPHIDSIYPTTSYRMFFGQHIGGLLVMNTLINHPSLFNAYVSMDPSLWWDQQQQLKKAEEVLVNNNYSNKSLYISIANTLPTGMDTTKAMLDTTESTFHFRSIVEFGTILQKHSKSGLNWDSKYYPSYNHLNVPEISEDDALHFFFKDYKLDVNLYDMSLNSDSAIISHYNKLSKQMGYTVHPPESLINELGNYYLTNNRVEKAEVFYKLNTLNYPQSLLAHNNLGLFYEKLGDTNKAIECYSKELLIKDDPAITKKIKKMKKRKSVD